MTSYILGILTVFLIRFISKPKSVVIYGQEFIEMTDTDYEEEMRSFSTNIDGIRYSWEVEKLWAKFDSLDPVDWEIPESFKDEWSWGQSHPSEHIERCLDADLSYPILVWDGAIIDGCHRVVKALAKGDRTIKAKIIINIPPPDEETLPEPTESNKGVYWTYGDMELLVRSVMEYEEIKEYKFRHPADGI